jgi:hypothetical protein
MLRLSSFPGDVQLVPMTGLTLANAMQVVPADNVVVAVGKLQAQVNNLGGIAGSAISYMMVCQNGAPLQAATGDPFWKA